jgi:hypothetical protein
MLIIRKILWFFSKKDLEAILKYDPLNILNNKKKKYEDRNC